MSKSMRTAFILIGAFFVALFIGLGITLRLAFSGFEPAMDENYYEKGLDYQPRLDALQRGKEQGWTLSPGFANRSAIPASTEQIVWRLENRSGAAVESGELRVTIDRPASVRGRQVEVQPLSDARRVAAGSIEFVTPTRFRVPGEYEIGAVATVNDVAVAGAWRVTVVSGAN